MMLHLDESADVNYDELDPNIRRVVRLLRDNGFNTCDSGDGSKAATMECAVAWPMVAMLVDPEKMVGEAVRLELLLKTHGVVFEVEEERDHERPRIVASYDPTVNTAFLVLEYVSDTSLAPIV